MFKAFFKLGGRRWIRTIEAKRNRFTVCPLWPLGNSPISSFSKIKAYCLNSRLQWSWWTDLNPRPADYKSAALPTELHQPVLLDLSNWRYLLYHISKHLSSTFYFVFIFLIKWSRRQDLNLRHLGPKPSTLPNWVTPRSWRCTRWGKVSSHGKVPSFVCLELHRCFCEAFVCVIRQLNYYTPQCLFCQ